MNRDQIEDIIDEIIYEAVLGKNPFKVGDLVKLRPDTFDRYSKRSDAQSYWLDTLKKIQDQVGKVIKLLGDNSKSVNVKFPDISVGINYTELVPANKPITEGMLGWLKPSKVSVGVEARQLVANYNAGKVDRATLEKELDRLMWKARTNDPQNFPMLKATVDKINARKQQPQGIQLKFEEGFGYVSDKDMAKDPKHIKGERWRIKFQSASDLKKHGNTEKSPVSENISVSDVKEVIQELIREMWIGWEEEEEGKTDEGIKDFVKKTWNNIKPDTSTEESDRIGDFIRHIQKDPKMRNAFKAGELGNVDLKKYVRESDWFHPDEKHQEPPKVIPGVQKLSMMKPTSVASIQKPKLTQPTSNPSETPEELRSRLLAKLHNKKENISEVNHAKADNGQWIIAQGAPNSIIRFTTTHPVLLKHMRDWVKDVKWREVSDETDIDDMSDEEILRGVEKHYQGGIKQFIEDARLQNDPEVSSDIPRLAKEGEKTQDITINIIDKVKKKH